jgi:1-acyl-sn-glycerol-3-phosphate acyltransferase
MFFRMVVRPVLAILLGANVRNREWLPSLGPAILASNHNSHLDTLVILDLCSGENLDRVRPVAAADYFLRRAWLAWFAANVIGILPVRRQLLRHKPNPLDHLVRALKRGTILLFFPEGSRGEPEILVQYKAGLARLAEACPEVPVVPIYIYGLGKALSKGEWIPVPFFIDVVVGEPLRYGEFGNRRLFMKEYARRMEALRAGIQHLDYH